MQVFFFFSFQEISIIFFTISKYFSFRKQAFLGFFTSSSMTRMCTLAVHTIFARKKRSTLYIWQFFKMWYFFTYKATQRKCNHIFGLIEVKPGPHFISRTRMKIHKKWQPKESSFTLTLSLLFDRKSVVLFFSLEIIVLVHETFVSPLCFREKMNHFDAVSAM